MSGIQLNSGKAPESADNTLSAKTKLDKMLNAHLNLTKQSVLKDAFNPTQTSAVYRTSNHDFLQEFNKIFHGREPNKLPQRKPKPSSSLKDEVQPHGMNLINFTLTEHLLQDKINEAATEMVMKTE